MALTLPATGGFSRPTVASLSASVPVTIRRTEFISGHARQRRVSRLHRPRADAVSWDLTPGELTLLMAVLRAAAGGWFEHRVLVPWEAGPRTHVVRETRAPEMTGMAFTDRGHVTTVTMGLEFATMPEAPPPADTTPAQP